MCGIAGLMSVVNAPPDPDLVPVMLQRLAHRGPDDGGHLALGAAVIGMRRLSILDTSERGHQPMRSTDGRYTIVHNDIFDTSCTDARRLASVLGA